MVFTTGNDWKKQHGIKGAVHLAHRLHGPGGFLGSRNWIFSKLGMDTLGTHRVYPSEFRRSRTILIFTFSWGPPFGFLTVIYRWPIFKKPKGGTPWNRENQNCPRPSILVVVNHTGTQSVHAKFWRNSLLGRLNTSKGIQAGGKLSIPFEDSSEILSLISI